MPPYFSVAWRNPGHWDISDGQRRAFRIRGEPGRVVVFDERERERGTRPQEPEFRSVQAALAWIADEMMVEPLPPLEDFNEFGCMRRPRCAVPCGTRLCSK